MSDKNKDLIISIWSQKFHSSSKSRFVNLADFFCVQRRSLVNETWNWFSGISILRAWLGSRRRRNIFWIFDQLRILPPWIFPPHRHRKIRQKLSICGRTMCLRIMVSSCPANQGGLVILFWLQTETQHMPVFCKGLWEKLGKNHQYVIN